MHDSNATSNKPKQQSSCNECNALHDTVPVEPSSSFPKNPLNWQYSYFNVDGYPAASSGRRMADALDGAFNVASAIESISEMLLADDAERDNDEGKQLRDGLRFGLTIGLYELAKRLKNDLCITEIGLHNQYVKDMEGSRV